MTNDQTLKSEGYVKFKDALGRRDYAAVREILKDENLNPVTAHSQGLLEGLINLNSHEALSFITNAIQNNVTSVCDILNSGLLESRLGRNKDFGLKVLNALLRINPQYISNVLDQGAIERMINTDLSMGCRAIKTLLKASPKSATHIFERGLVQKLNKVDPRYSLEILEALADAGLDIFQQVRNNPKLIADFGQNSNIIGFFARKLTDFASHHDYGDTLEKENIFRFTGGYFYKDLGVVVSNLVFTPFDPVMLVNVDGEPVIHTKNRVLTLEELKGSIKNIGDCGFTSSLSNEFVASQYLYATKLNIIRTFVEQAIQVLNGPAVAGVPRDPVKPDKNRYALAA